MAEVSSVSPTQPPSNEELSSKSHPETATESQSRFSKLLNAFKRPNFSDDTDNTHGLYNFLRHYAESIKIILQMSIGVILGIALLIDGFAFLLSVFGNPSKISFATFNPLDIIAYGLFFSTGVDLAYMLFTPGPDEAIDPVMTGLAAAILLGIGNIGDISKLDIQHAIILTLAVAALAGLFATKKYLFHPSDKNEKDRKTASLLTQQEGEI